MAENHNESQDDHGLQNLPQAEREATQKILTEIEEGTKKPETDDKTQKSEEEVKPEKEVIKEDEKKPDLEKTEKKPRRESGLVPAYKAGIEKTRHEQEVKALNQQIEDLKKGTDPEKKVDEQQKETITDDVNKIAQDLIDKHNVEDPELIKDIFEKVASLVNSKTAIPQELIDKLAVIDQLKSDAEIKTEELNFGADFDEDVLPLIKAEYGDDVTAEKIAEIKDKLKKIAYTPEYAKVPYDEIYNGKSDFRGLVAQKKKSAEGNREGFVQLKEGEKAYSEMSEADAANLPPDEFQKWSDAMAKGERK